MNAEGCLRRSACLSRTLYPGCLRYGRDGDHTIGRDVLSGAAAGPARERGAHLDGAGLGSSLGGPGGGLPGISSGPAGVAEYGEVLRAGVGVVVAVPGAVRTRLGRGDVGELRCVSDVVAHWGRAGSGVDRAPWCPIRPVDDLRTAGCGVVLLRLSRAQRVDMGRDLYRITHRGG